MKVNGPNALNEYDQITSSCLIAQEELTSKTKLPAKLTGPEAAANALSIIVLSWEIVDY
jgi:hypothetical protein